MNLSPNSNPLQICTTSEGKYLEFKKFLGPDLSWIKASLKEPVADPLTIIRYKASQLEGVLVDDTSLFVSGTEIGSLIKFKLQELPQWIGQSAEFICLLGIHRNGQIEVFEGRIRGKICAKKADGFGFDPYFQPEGSSQSYAESKPDFLNARYLACQAFLESRPQQIVAPLIQWDGHFQRD